MENMTIRGEFIDEVLECLEHLMEQTETEGEEKLLYEMTLAMKENLEFMDKGVGKYDKRKSNENLERGSERYARMRRRRSR